jgi:hypothetical protein
MIKKYITLFSLCLSFFGCYASTPAAKAPGKWYEKIEVEKDTQLKTVDVDLFLSTAKESKPKSIYTKKNLKAHAEGSYNPTTNLAFIDKIEVLSSAQRRGCGSRLFKQTVSLLYQNFPCSKIIFLASPYLDQENGQALERLEKFYVKLGSVIVERCKQIHGTDMLYPLHLASALASLMPLLEPHLLDESLANDPVTTIIQYVGPTNEYPAEPLAALAPASIPLNTANCVSK